MSNKLENAKQVEFCYNGDYPGRDIEVDSDGKLPYYQVGDVVERQGKSWKVTKVLIQQSLVNPPSLLTHIITVTDKY
jgi:hypothetical protein